MWWRIFATLFVLITWTLTSSIYSILVTPLVSEITVNSMTDPVAFQKAQAANLMYHNVLLAAGTFWVLVLIGVWWKYLQTGWKMLFPVVAIFTFYTPDANAYRFKTDWSEYYFAKSNESVFNVPMLADAKNQKQVRSEDFYKANMVSGQYIQIGHGTLSGTGNFINDTVNTTQIIVVDRTPVALEWTHASHTGSSSKDESFNCETAQSHNVRTDITAAFMIEVDDAAKYLYFAGPDMAKPLPTSQSGGEAGNDKTFISAIASVPLRQFVDTFGRRIVQVALCEEIGKRQTDEVIAKKSEIITAVKDKASAELKKMGITTIALGQAGPLDWSNRIQTSIDEVYVAGKRKAAAAAIADALPTLERQAKVEAMLGFATALKEGKLPALPNFVGAIPPELIDAFKTYVIKAGEK